MRRWGIGLGALALVSCGVVLSWSVPDEVAWTVLVALSPDERPVEVGPLRTGEALATTAVDLDARVLALGFTAEAVAALGAEVPVDAVLVPTADPCAPRFAAPTWARRTQGDGTVPVDADPAFAPELTADWLPPHCAEGNLCMGGQCEPRVAEVAIGRNHACARRADGKVACWGDNQLGQVGVSVEPFVTRATEVVGVEGALQLGLGSHHTCARVEGGKVSCWGANGAGQLGDGALRDRRTPDLVPGIEGALDLATGDGHNCALLGPDDVRCWGSNDSGQLGDGGEAPGTTPVRVEGLTGVRRLAAGNAHTCALQAGGVVTCWGDGTLGQLGPRGGRGPGPARVLEKDAEALAAGEAHTCARLAGGEVLCWGDDGAGQLGGGSPPLLAPAVGVAAGARWSCATLEDGRMQCWGDNRYGQRGTDPLLLYSRDRPELMYLATGLSKLTLGERSGCGLDAELRVRCWGWNGYGQLGNGTAEFQPTPRGVLAAELVSLAAGEEHTCALDLTGQVQCWGGNYWGQVGATYYSVTEGPKTVAGLSRVVEVGAGNLHTCARTDEGRVWCWGTGGFGQLGVDLSLSAEPVAVPELSGASSLAVGASHGCVVEGAPGPVSCWGANHDGQLGADVGEDFSVARVAVPGVTDAIQVAAGVDTSCALRAGGTVRCWGARVGGWDLGVDDVAEVRLGRYFGCVRKVSGAVLCFGTNDHGQLGDGTRADHSYPAQVVDLPDAVSLSTGSSHACAVRADGSLWCWGDNEWNQQGDGTREDHLRPTAVQGLGGPVRNVACGARHTMAFEAPGRVEAWGWNAMGQLGRTPVGLGQPAGLVMGLP